MDITGKGPLKIQYFTNDGKSLVYRPLYVHKPCWLGWQVSRLSNTSNIVHVVPCPLEILLPNLDLDSRYLPRLVPSPTLVLHMLHPDLPGSNPSLSEPVLGASRCGAGGVRLDWPSPPLVNMMEVGRNELVMDWSYF